MQQVARAQMVWCLMAHIVLNHRIVHVYTRVTITEQERRGEMAVIDAFAGIIL